MAEKDCIVTNDVGAVCEDDNIRACDYCGVLTSHERKTEDMPEENSVCSICNNVICNDCIDWSAGLGNEPFPNVDVVCVRCSESARNI